MSKRQHTDEIVNLIDNESDSTENIGAEPPPKKRKQIPRILDGKHFSIVSQVGEKIVARCMECDETKKGQLTSTGNFINHYRTKHSPQMTALEQHLKGTGKENATQKVGPRQPTISELTSTVNPQRVSHIAAFLFCFGRFIYLVYYDLALRRHRQLHPGNKFTV